MLGAKLLCIDLIMGRFRRLAIRLHVLQERAHKHALQRVVRADAFAVEHKRVNEWDLSDVMATFANQYRQELRCTLHEDSLLIVWKYLCQCGVGSVLQHA